MDIETLKAAYCAVTFGLEGHEKNYHYEWLSARGYFQRIIRGMIEEAGGSIGRNEVEQYGIELGRGERVWPRKFVEGVNG